MNRKSTDKSIDVRIHKGKNGLSEGEFVMNHLSLLIIFYLLTHDKELLTLSLAWDKRLYETQETEYIQTMLRERTSGNIPLLLCPDDLDFSCTIVVVKVSFDAEKVCWHKIGYVNKNNYSLEAWKKSGYMDYSTWKEKDFEKYSEDYFFKAEKNIDWEKLWSLEWQEEARRRLWHYEHPYFNNDENIDWIVDLNWSFDVAEYNHALDLLIEMAEKEEEKEAEKNGDTVS